LKPDFFGLLGGPVSFCLPFPIALRPTYLLSLRTAKLAQTSLGPPMTNFFRQTLRVEIFPSPFFLVNCEFGSTIWVFFFCFILPISAFVRQCCLFFLVSLGFPRPVYGSACFRLSFKQAHPPFRGATFCPATHQHSRYCVSRWLFGARRFPFSRLSDVVRERPRSFDRKCYLFPGFQARIFGFLFWT